MKLKLLPSIVVPSLLGAMGVTASGLSTLEMGSAESAGLADSSDADRFAELADLVDGRESFRFAVESEAAGGASHDDLAKKLANPIAAMISVPFQNNFDFGAGPDGDGWQWKLNFQPVIPFSLNDDWNLITRTIIPIVYQEDVGVGSISVTPGIGGPGIGRKNIDVRPSGQQFGVGDTVFSTWLSPKDPFKGWIWGIGPVFYLPTGTDSDDGLGTSQWGLGPTIVALRQQGKFSYGILLNHIWGLDKASNQIPALSNTFIQPFFNYLPGGGWTFALNTESTYNWRKDDDELTMPINASVKKLFKIGDMPAQWEIGGRYYAVKQDTGPEWGMRFTITLLLPQ